MVDYDPNAPATKGDLQQMRDELREVVRDSETRVLGGFHSFAESNQKRMAAGETENSALKSRLATIEERLANVEKRLNTPPAVYFQKKLVGRAW